MYSLRFMIGDDNNHVAHNTDLLFTETVLVPSPTLTLVNKIEPPPKTTTLLPTQPLTALLALMDNEDFIKVEKLCKSSATMPLASATKKAPTLQRRRSFSVDDLYTMKKLSEVIAMVNI